MDLVPSAVRRLRPQHWLLLAACVGALLFAGAHTLGAARRAAQLRAHGPQPIAEWMTVAHVARMHRVPPAVLEEALGLPPGRRDRRPLRVIATQRGESFEALRDRMLTAIERSQQGPAPPGGSGTQ